MRTSIMEELLLGGCCLDRGALINVEAPGCGMLVVRDPTGHK